MHNDTTATSIQIQTTVLDTVLPKGSSCMFSSTGKTAFHTTNRGWWCAFVHVSSSHHTSGFKTSNSKCRQKSINLIGIRPIVREHLQTIFSKVTSLWRQLMTPLSPSSQRHSYCRLLMRTLPSNIGHTVRELWVKRHQIVTMANCPTTQLESYAHNLTTTYSLVCIHWCPAITSVQELQICLSYPPT